MRLLDFAPLKDADFARLMLDAAEEITILRQENKASLAHLTEIYPYFESWVLDGVRLGLPPEDHPADGCEDCVWFEESVKNKARIDSGEFDYITKSEYNDPTNANNTGDASG